MELCDEVAKDIEARGGRALHKTGRLALVPLLRRVHIRGRLRLQWPAGDRLCRGTDAVRAVGEHGVYRGGRGAAGDLFR